MPSMEQEGGGVSKHRHEAWFGRFDGPDHLYRNCPALARVTPYDGAWPRKTLDLVDPLGSDICGWCVWNWRRTEAAA